jgi:hypothetical protein
LHQAGNIPDNDEFNFTPVAPRALLTANGDFPVALFFELFNHCSFYAFPCFSISTNMPFAPRISENAGFLAKCLFPENILLYQT